MPIDSTLEPTAVLNGRENAQASKRALHSAPDPSLHNRRQSLPLHLLPTNLWNSNTSTATLVEAEEAARGEHILDEATVAYRITALRRFDGATRSSGHQYAKSTGAKNSTYSQPVIVRTYSGPSKPQSTLREPDAKKKLAMGTAKLPPIEAFSFKGILDSIGSGVYDDLERIAEICARSRYSLSNQYEVHMQPHGTGEDFSQVPGQSNPVIGPTLQAIVAPHNAHPPQRAKPRGARRGAKSAAYGTLETIMSSSRSSDEDQTKKKPAAVIADEVRGRSKSNTPDAARKDTDIHRTTAAEQTGSSSNSEEPRPPCPEDKNESLQRGAGAITQPKRTMKSSIPFASLMIDNAQKPPKYDSHKPSSSSSLISPSVTVLTSEPAKPMTSTIPDFQTIPTTSTSTYTSLFQAPPTAEPFPAFNSTRYPRSSIIRNESTASATTLAPPRPLPSSSRAGAASSSFSSSSLFAGLPSWMRWGRSGGGTTQGGGVRRPPSYAEGSLRDLLRGKVNGGDRKGKGVDRGG